MAHSNQSSNGGCLLFRSFALVILLLLAIAPVDAQRRKAPQPSQQQNTQSVPPAPQKKRLAPLRSSDAAEGSRVTITSDGVLNQYSAYRSGDRFYVVIPKADSPGMQSSMRGRGYEDVKVQRKGDDTVLSFRLQPGAKARVEQKFNKLDVVINTPGKSSTGENPVPGVGVTRPVAKPTPSVTTDTRNNTAQPPVRPATAQTLPNAGANANRNRQNNITMPGGIQSGSNAPTGAENMTTAPGASTPTQVSPALSPATQSASANTEATPPANQIAQVQQGPVAPPVTTAQPAVSGSSFGAVLKSSWLPLLVAGLLLLGLVAFVAMRSRAQRDPVARRLDEKKKRLVEESAVERAALTEAPVKQPVVERPAAISPTALSGLTLVGTAAPADQTQAVAAGSDAIEEVAPEQAEPVASVDLEHAGAEVHNMLAGESYDESIIGSQDVETRQLVAAELVAALAGTNPKQRESARNAFIKYNYFDEATYDLRTADAPAQRVAAARSLGIVKDQAATPHLIAALEDGAPEVRRAAVEALAEMRDPAAVAPLQSLLEREKSGRVPQSLIKQAMEASAASAEATTVATASPAIAVETPSVETEQTVEAPGLPFTESESVAPQTAHAIVETPTVETPAVETSTVETPVAEEPTHAAPLTAKADEQSVKSEQPPVAVKETPHTKAPTHVDAGGASIAPVVAAGLAAVGAEALLQQRKGKKAARKRAEEEERKRVEEEARQRADAETARVQAAEEAARRRAAEEEQRRAEDARRQAEEEAARQRALEENRRKAAEETARQRAEEDARQRREEEATRVRIEAETRQREEEAARRRAEEERQRIEAEARERAEAEATRRRIEEETRQRIEEENRRRQAAETKSAAPDVHVKSYDLVEPVPTEAASQVASPETLIERNDGTASEWVDIDMNEVEVSQTPPASETRPAAFDKAIQVADVRPETITIESVEPILQPTAAPESFAERTVKEPTAGAATKEIESAVAEKSILPAAEFSTVPSAVLKQLGSEEASERAEAVAHLERLGGDDAFRQISAAFDDPAQDVRNAAARSLYNLNADRAASFTRALREAPPERRRNIGSALASSGLASEAISHLTGESREKTYDAFSLLFLMSKAGEVQPLLRAIEEHPNSEVRLAVVKLLALSGQHEILPAFRRLAVRGSLPTEVRSAVMEAIYQISSQASSDATSTV